MDISPKDRKVYDAPIALGDGIWWVGFYDAHAKLHCNPYLVVDEDEAVLIDGGSRPDFPVVAMKILQTGIIPRRIACLIYSHYDPDLCGSIPHLEALIDAPELRIVSERTNNAFIRHYAPRSPLQCIHDLGCRWSFRSGRELLFLPVPYAHAAGSFLTLDRRSGTLFSGDVFGGYGAAWDLLLKVDPACRGCVPTAVCLRKETPCPLDPLMTFHRRVMPSNRALALAVRRIREAVPCRVAPQHGSVVEGAEAIETVCSLLERMDVGIDAFGMEP